MIPHVPDPITLAAAGATCALGLLAIVWLASSEKVGTVKVVGTRHRCGTRHSHGTCGRYVDWPAENGPYGTVIYRCGKCQREGRW